MGPGLEAGPCDGSRHDIRNHGGWRKAVIGDNTTGVMDNQNCGEAFLLIGQRPVF